jgi:plasmid stability protein
MEDEARNILRAALDKDATTPRNLAQTIRQRFEPLGSIELTPPERHPIRKPPGPRN